MSLKSAVGYVPGLLGYEIRRKQPHLAESVLARAAVETVLDVGANTGQFARAVRASHPVAIVHCFEPIPAVFAELHAAFQKDPNIHAYDVAVSDSEADAEFEQNEATASSSLLPLDETHKRLYPTAVKVTRIKVRVTTLDAWADGRELARPLVLKLDVQGNELSVLRGASAVLPKVDYVLTEVNFGAMYRGQPTFDDLHQELRAYGLHFIDFFSAKRDQTTLRCMFGDALFARD